IAQSFRARLLLELPRDKQDLDRTTQQLTHRAKAMIKDLSHINLEIAQMVVSSDEDKVLPEWFMVEIVRDLPRLVKNGG
ncbi:MAG: MoxR family ATPase, partial [Oscillospiraceae bacterium]|nr:MoxR family ATPase [Oscillospiraceae bacterium]